MPDDIKTILRELKEGLQKIYGDQLKAVILFGSYARGDARSPDSDIDVMIVLKGEFDYWAMSDLCSQFVMISRKIVSETKYANSRFPLFINVRRVGVAV